MQIHSNLISDIIKFFHQELNDTYTESELQLILNWVFEKQLNLSSTQVLNDKDIRVNQSDLIILEQMCYKLKEHMPIQYVLGETEFYRLKFKINKHVLIPRPETEELVDTIIKDSRLTTNNFRLLDIGTGSGCIPISIKKNIPNTEIFAFDISNNALDVAHSNALLNKTDVHFFQADVLRDNIGEIILTQTQHQKIDVLVSNPPYVLQSEENGLEKRVKDHEPHLALFVTDADPILFYRKIALLAKQILVKNGSLYLECHTNYAKDVYQMLVNLGYKNVVLSLDMAQKPRFVWAKGY